MCGFVVVVKKNNDFFLNEIEKRQILFCQKHRGPDISKYKKKDNLFFFHNRLKIIDLSNKSNQPFESKKTGNIIVFNGEVYNYQELKNKINYRKFYSKSDTEVLLYLYEELGEKFVNFLNGIFSFVIYDRKKNKLIFARDRFGVKPLYFYQDIKKIVLSTEARPILKINKRFRANYSEIKNYISSGTLYHRRNTFFKNIYLHPASTISELNLNKFKVTKNNKYWRLKKNKSEKCKNFQEFYKKFKIKFRESLKLNLVSDVKVGLLHSSGTDSNFIKSFIEKDFKKKINSYTFGWKNKKYDEIKLLKKIGHKINRKNSVILNGNQILKKLKEMIHNCEGPIGGFGTAGVYNLMKIIQKNKTKVVLSGEGGDEFFLGYLNLKIIFLRNLYKKNKKLFLKELKKFNKLNNKNFKNKKDFFSFSKNFLSGSLFTPDGRSVEDLDLVITTKKTNIEKKQLSSNLIVKNYAERIKLPKLLSFLDKCSGAHGVECRVPMLDHNLVSFIYSNEDAFKIKNGVTKYPVTKWLEENNSKYFVSKLNVSTEQREFFKNKSVYKKTLNMLKDGELVKAEILNFSVFKKKYQKYLNQSDLGNSFFIWKVINAEYFLRAYNREL